MKKLRTAFSVGAIALSLSLSYSSTSRADPPSEQRPNRTMLWTGVTVFAVTYTGSVVAAGVAGDRVEDKNLFIPVVGPWLDLGQRNCEFRRCDDQQEAIFKTLIITSGILQGASVLLTLSSFFVPETRKAPPYTARTATAQAKPELHLAPMSFSGGAGLGAGGRF